MKGKYRFGFSPENKFIGWRRETGKFEIIRKNEGNLQLSRVDAENVFYKSGNFIIRHHFLKNYVCEVLSISSNTFSSVQVDSEDFAQHGAMCCPGSWRCFLQSEP